MDNRKNAHSAFWFDISGLSFKPVNDVGPMVDYRAMDLLARALVVWVVTIVRGARCWPRKFPCRARFSRARICRASADGFW